MPCRKHYFIDSVATAHMHTAGCNHVVTRLYQALPLPCYKHAMCMVAQACKGSNYDSIYNVTAYIKMYNNVFTTMLQLWYN